MNISLLVAVLAVVHVTIAAPALVVGPINVRSQF